jgi:hypothetical protein
LQELNFSEEDKNDKGTDKGQGDAECVKTYYSKICPPPNRIIAFFGRIRTTLGHKCFWQDRNTANGSIKIQR